MQKPDLSTSRRAVWRLTWPQLIMMYLMFIMSFVPVWTAGRLGANIQASLGMVSQCSLFLSVVSMGLSSGATAAVSQALGALRVGRARRYIAATLGISVGLGLIMTSLGLFFIDGILNLVHLPPDIFPEAKTILLIFLCGLPFSYVYAATGVIFRSTRQVIPPLIVSAVLCCAHAVICAGTGLGLFGLPDWGYLGIAWASVAVNVLGSIINCVLLARAGYLSRSALPKPGWLKKGLPYLARVSIPAGFSSLVWQSGYMVLFILVASVPFQNVEALAGLTAGLRIEGFLFMPGMAFNMVAAVMVGNCLGAGNEREARRVALSLLATAVFLMSIVAAIIWPFRTELAALLSDDPVTRGYIADYLWYNLISTPFSITSTVFGGVMIGAGATRLNLMVFGASFWLVRLPLGYLLGHIVWGNACGIFCAMLISQILQTTCMLIVFFRVRWVDYAMRAHIRKDPARPAQ